MAAKKAQKTRAAGRKVESRTGRTTAARTASKSKGTARGAQKTKPKASQVGASVPLSELPAETHRLAPKRGVKAPGQNASTRVANPKRSTTQQASKRARARGVDGRLAR